MKVSPGNTENRQMVLEIEADPEEIESSLDVAYNRLVKRANIPGFRKGKAPRQMVERHLGKEVLLQEALEHLVPQLLDQAISEQGLEPIAQPEVEITRVDPLAFKATVPLKPTVELGKYLEIRIDKEPVTVTEENVNSVIEQLRQQQGTWEPADRSVQLGDLVTINVVGSVDGEKMIEKNDLQFQVLKGMPVPVPGFAEALEGMEKGVEKEFTISVPEDYAVKGLAGKGCLFKVEVTEVKGQKLPELNDEFAKSLGQGFETLEALKQDVKSNLTAMAEDGARRSFENKAIEALVGVSNVEFPQVMVEREIDRLISAQENELKANRISLEDYLRNRKKSIEELREEIRPVAIKQINSSLVLSQLAEDEKIAVSDEELDEEIQTMVNNSGKQGENMKKLFQSPRARSSLQGMLLTKKTVSRLVEIASGESKPKLAKIGDA